MLLEKMGEILYYPFYTIIPINHKCSPQFVIKPFVFIRKFIILLLIDCTKGDFEISRGSSLPRSCFELKATNPTAKSGVYFIDPDGQFGGDPPIQVFCDMATRNNIDLLLSNSFVTFVHISNRDHIHLS